MALVALWLPVVATVWVLERDGLKRRAGRMFRRLFPPIEAQQHRDAAVLREEARRVIAGQVSDWRSRATEGGLA